VAKADWNFSWCLKVDNLSIRRMCSGRELPVDDTEAEKGHEEKLLMMPYGLARRFVLEERKDLDGR